MEETLSVQNLCKRYTKNGAYAIRDISFSCHAGEIVGLLGHNGAGKSTTLKCLEGMLPFEEGEISICGYDIRRDPIRAKRNFGFVTDDHALFERMTGRQYLAFLANIYRVPAREREERYERLEEVFRLGGAVEDLVSSYSHGMRQKLCMMGSLIHRPALWVLDEPMTGLDPFTMRSVRDYMRKYADEGHAVLFSSHALETVARVCDRVELIRGGRHADSLEPRKAKDPLAYLEERYFYEA